MSLNKIMLLVLLIFAFAIQPVNILAENTDEKLTGKIIRINHRPANSLIEVLKVYLSGEGKIIADEHTNSIVIRDFPGNIGKIEAMAANLDVPLPQVKIGVTILDTANTNTASIFGSAYNVNNKWNVAVSPDISQVQNRGTTNMTLTTLSGSSAFIRIGKRVPFTDWFYSYALGHNYITKTTVF
ncbi:MAG: secretin N-terminal domain-containing protein, partial [Vulcanimicrobiota bacterium]